MATVRISPSVTSLEMERCDDVNEKGMTCCSLLW